MGFTIPNDVAGGTAKQHAQAAPDSVDIDILIAGHNLTGVQSGCAVSAQGSPNMTLAVASGTVGVAGVAATVTSGNVTITTADGSHPRFDLVVVNSSGTKSVTAGTATAAPVFPAIPASSVVLAAVYVGAGVTSIATADIVDKRVILNSTAYVSSNPAASVLAYIPGCQLVVDLNADNILGNDGDAITVWPDASGFGNHFIAGTTAPTLKKNIINGHAVMRTGAAGWMVSPPGIGIYPGITQPSFYVAVIRCDSGSGFRTILGGQSTTVNNLLLDTTQQTLSLNGGGTLPKGGKRLDDGLPHIVVGRFDTFSQGYADGVTVCFTSAGGSGAQALIGVGDKYTGGQNLVGDIGRVLMYNGRPSRAGLALLQQGLAA